MTADPKLGPLLLRNPRVARPGLRRDLYGMTMATRIGRCVINPPPWVLRQTLDVDLKSQALISNIELK